MKAQVQGEFVTAVLRPAVDPETGEAVYLAGIDDALDVPAWAGDLTDREILRRARVVGGSIADVLTLSEIFVDAGGWRHAAPAAGRQPVSAGWDDPLVLGPDGLWAPVAAVAAMRSELLAAIDAEAERQRLRWITPGAGQAMTYARKVEEAYRLEADGDPQPESYPMLAASLGIDGTTLAAIGATVLEMDRRWTIIGSAIEARRLRLKHDVAAAADAGALSAIVVTAGWPEAGAG